MMKTGRPMLDEIRDCTVPVGRVAFWWLGQQQVIFKSGDHLIFVDVFLKPRPDRLVPPAFAPAEVDLDVTFICGTHDHSDHIDRHSWPELARRIPGATFVVPDLLLQKVSSELGIPPGRFAGLDEGRTVEKDEIRITALPASHEFLDRDAATGHYPYLCLVLEMGGRTIFHAGDTCKYEGLETSLRRWKFDAMFLPINGRDGKRLAANLIGNMTYQEAVDLAGALKPGVVVPGHYDMFAKNSGDVQAFVEYLKVKYPGQGWLTPAQGECVFL